MKYFDSNYNLISENEVDLNKGYCIDFYILKENVETINETKSVYQPEDFEKAKMYCRISDKEILQNQINELKQKLSNTDYVAIKISEGAATQEEYAEVLTERANWREQINKLETQVAALD